MWRNSLFSVVVLFSFTWQCSLGIPLEYQSSCNFTCSSSHDLCYCDSACSLFGDCCVDWPHLQPTARKQVQCHFNSEILNFIYQINKCNEDYPVSEDTRQRCHSNSTFSEDPFQNILVTSPTTKITYKNSHCAICNGEKIFIEWKLRAKEYHEDSISSDLNISKTDILDRLEFDERNQTWKLWLGFNGQRHFVAVSLSLEQSDDAPPRRCQEDAISECPDHWTDLTIRHKCDAVSDPVVIADKNYIVYKNRYCARCHGILEDALTCYDLSQPPPTVGIGDKFFVSPSSPCLGDFCEED